MAATRAATDTSLTIPMESFSAMIMEIKVSKGYSWRQMSHLSGRTVSHISSLGLGGGKKKRIRSDTAHDILRRLAGERMPPTPYQVKLYNERLQRVQREQRAESLKQKKIEERHVKLESLSLRLGAGQDESAQG